MLPADLANKVRRWEWTSSVKEEGFRADSARVEFGPIDAVTYQAVATYLNDASNADRIEVRVKVGVGQEPVLLFWGPVAAWTFEQRFEEGRQTSVGVLEALDERALLIRAIPEQHVVYPGVGRAVGAWAPNSSLVSVVGDLAATVGVALDVAKDYVISHHVMPQGWRAGQVIASLMSPLQQVRSTRLDMVRAGGVYVIQQRSLVLGAADVTIAYSVVSEFRARRSRPKPSIISSRGQAGKLVPLTPKGGGRSAYSPLDDWGYRELRTTLPDGTLTQRFLHGRLYYEKTERVVTSQAPGGVSASVVDEKNLLYTMTTPGEPQAVRFTGHDATQSYNGLEVRREQYRVYYSEKGDIVAQSTRTWARAPARPNDGLRLEESVYTSVARAGGGTIKTAGRERVSGKSVISDARQHDYSPGGSGAQGELLGSGIGAYAGPGWNVDPTSRSPFLQEQGDVDQLRANAAAEAGMHLIEYSLTCPLTLDIMPGRILAVTGSPVTPSKFYVTAVRAGWSIDESTHVMSVEGEAWV